MRQARTIVTITLAITSLLASEAFGQAHQRVVVPRQGRAPAIVELPDAASPAVRSEIQQNRSRAEMERELKRIRALHFKSMRNVEIRQAGMDRLKSYTDPIIFPSLLELFRREREDVRRSVLDHLHDQGTDEADATLAWAAIFEKDAWMRVEAGARLRDRTDSTGVVSNRVKLAIERGLRGEREREMVAAAELANLLNLFEAIPAIISAQIGADDAGDGQQGALADILVATQQAFVRDLQPVVGDNAVAFDPEVGVVTSGTILRVMGAYVVTYRTEVHAPLVDLSTRAWGGRSTASLGWDNPAWHAWYTGELVPYLAAQEQTPAEASAKEPAPI